MPFIVVKRARNVAKDCKLVPFSHILLCVVLKIVLVNAFNICECIGAIRSHAKNSNVLSKNDIATL